MANQKSQKVLFITGAFVSNACWDEWRKYFESKGFETFAPPWPHKDAPADELRNRHPDHLVASNRLGPLTDYYASLTKQFSQKPILIGHSIGGLIVQLLLQRGLGALGIAIHSVPPQGVFTFRLSFFKAGWKALGFFTPTSKTYLISFREWSYAFANGMSCEDQTSLYYQFAIPESKRIVRDTITDAAKIDFKKPHAPLLLISGSDDNTIPASLNYSNFKKYRNDGSTTDYKEFPGRNHFVLGQSSWRENADYILEWIAKHQTIKI
jgi:pimeloyl-ACP methyl ester carboxylesterase